MKRIIIVAMGMMISFSGNSQKAKDLLKNGVRAKSGEIYFNHNLEYNEIQKGAKGFLKFGDSVIIQVPQSYGLYIKAYNPLHMDFGVTTKLEINPIDDVVFKKLNGLESPSESVTESESSFFESLNFLGMLPDSIPKKNDGENLVSSLYEDIKMLSDTINKRKYNKQCLNIANRLFKLNFQSPQETADSVDAIEVALFELKNQRIKNVKSLDELKRRFGSDEMKSRFKAEWKGSLVLLELLQDISTVLEEQKKLIKNVESIEKKVSDQIKKWGDFVTGGKWFITIEKGLLDKGVVEIVNLKLTKHKMSVKDGKIHKEESKELNKKIRLKRYELFILEISEGIVFAKQDLGEYSTDVDPNGVRTVSKTDGNSFERLNISTMLNFNFNIFNEKSLLPFIQLGVGLNEDVPLGLIGGGLRFNVGKTRVFAISAGGSFTGIKELQLLTLGEGVSSELKLENDLKYEFSGFKPYFGLQYNF